MSKQSIQATATTAASVVLLAAALGVGFATGQWLLAAGLAVVALLVAFAGPPILGRSSSGRGSPSRVGAGVDVGAGASSGQQASASALPSGAELRAWRAEHPGATIADAVDAHKLRG